ncbi:MAG: response regulator [Pseudomonadota bacterium]
MLNDANILIVEDEVLIALDISMMLEEEGASVVGPCADIQSALAKTSKADAAILDVDLRGEDVFPVADSLHAAGTPFLFHTGRRDTDVLRARYGTDVAIVEKPTTAETLLATVSNLLRT